MKSIISVLLVALQLTAAASVFGSEKVGGNEGTVVLISTSYGDIRVRLYDNTPQHRDNFIKLVKDGFYNDLLFHRVIKDFMVQGGDPDSRNAAEGQALGNGGPGYTIPAEINSENFHKKGVLAAARKGDQVNPKRASSGSQFYIVQGKTFTEDDLASMEERINRMKKNEYVQAFLSQKEYKVYKDSLITCQNEGNNQCIQDIFKTLNPIIDASFNQKGRFKFSAEQIEAYTTIGGTPHLDQAYTVFGEVIEGLDVVAKISVAKTNAKDRPLEDITMTITIDKNNRRKKKK